MASGSAGNSGKTGESVGDVGLVIGLLSVEVLLRQTDLCANGTDPASVCINDTGADSDAGGKTELGSGLLGEPADAFSGGGVLSVLVHGQPIVSMSERKKRRKYHPVDTTNTTEVVLGEIIQTDGAQEIVLPSLDTAINADRDEALLADDTAEATSLGASCDVGKGISQVVELATVEQLLGHVVLQPQDLGHLHLDTHLAANIAEKIVVSGIDLLRLFHRTVVKPENDVAVIAVSIVKLGTSHGDGLVGVLGKDSQRAGGVEANAAHSLLINLVLGHDTLDCFADTVPDVCGGLFLYRLEVKYMQVTGGIVDLRSTQLRAATCQCSH